MEASQLTQWESLVDGIAAMDSTDPLPPQHDPVAFLPGRQHVPAGLLSALRATGADFESASADVFTRGMTEAEAFHAVPNAPTFTSLTGPATAGEEEQSGRRRQRARKEGGGGDDDLYSRYRESSAAAAAAAAAAPSSSSPSSSYAAAMAPAPVLLPKMSKLTSGFLDPTSVAVVHKRPNFMPIILVPSAVTAPLQLINVRDFLMEGMYAPPETLFTDAQTGASNVQDTRPDSVVVTPDGFMDFNSVHVAFRNFLVVDDPARVEDWSHVCACLVIGKEWEFKEWFPDEVDPRATTPSYLFARLCGFLPYFEEDKIPPAVQEWHVQPIVLTRRATKAQQHIDAVFKFWQALYAFLDNHPFFKPYDVRAEE